MSPPEPGNAAARIGGPFRRPRSRGLSVMRFPAAGSGFLGVALAFGLTVLTMAYAFGHISGGHFNPAVTIGLWLGGRAPAGDVLPYNVTQGGAGTAGAGGLVAIASGKPGWSLSADGLAANGYGAHSPGHYGLAACLVTEVVMTLMFLLIILGSTDRRAPKGTGPVAIGLGLTLIHLISIPVTNTSVNPARSTGPALLMGGWALAQLWLFWVAPIIGGAVAGLAYKYIPGGEGAEPIAEEAQKPDGNVPIGELGAPGRLRSTTD